MKKSKKGATLPQLKKKALDELATLVKLRAEQDNNLFCYTCGSPLINHTSNCQLGHYLGRGCYAGLTFHPDNTRLQCYRCNCHLSGATIEFRIRLIAEIGIERVDKLESERHTPLKLSRLEYIDLIAKYREEIKLCQ
jgi:hypothetical protein